MKNMMMEKKILYGFFDGSASRKEKKIVREWLEEKPENKDELMKERAFFDAVLLSDSSAQKKTKLVRDKKTASPSFFVREILKIIAIITIVLTGTHYFYSGKMKEIRFATNTIVVPAGQRANLTLSDGTNVWLNAWSELQYPAFFTGSRREIKLKGEAYFEIQEDKNKPFIVQTNEYDVEVLGTKFNVEAYEDFGHFSTALMEGSVKIISRKDPAHTLLLTPNQKASIENGVLIARRIEDHDQYRWREGLICFKNTNFEELMRKFEKSYGIRIIIENPKLKEYSFSGKFRISDGVDNALRVLQKNVAYTFVRNDNDSEIYIK
jgi:ferric-dicitrate binding protein FerR (iron transport regulator)